MTEIAIPQPKPVKFQELDPEQKQLIKNTIAKGATDDEVDLFFHVCNRTGLDPFARQIYAIKRRSHEKGQWVERIVFQVSIEGFRLAAQRSQGRGGPKFEGPTPIQWCDEKGAWTELWLSKDPPFAARAGVYVEGFREPVYAIAEYKRLVQMKEGGGPNAFWEKGPAFMLGKCAEAAAIRKAFPNELSGFYLKEELYDIPEEKEINPPMTVEAAKALLSPAGQKPDSPDPTPEKFEIPPPPPQPFKSPVQPEATKGPPPEGKSTASAPPPKGEEAVPQPRLAQVKAHIESLNIQELLPLDLTEIEASYLMACKRADKAHRILDTMATSRDQKRPML